MCLVRVGFENQSKLSDFKAYFDYLMIRIGCYEEKVLNQGFSLWCPIQVRIDLMSGSDYLDLYNSILEFLVEENGIYQGLLHEEFDRYIE